MNRIFVLILVAFSTVAANAADCDRACMTGLLTTYIDAVVVHDPSRLPLANPNVRFTEDSKDLRLGEGIWKTATGKGGFRQDYIDLKAQVALTHVVLTEENAQAQYSVLLRVSDRKISGIETLINRITANSKFRPDSLDKPLRGMNDPVPADKRMPRAEMARTALTYTEGLRIGNFTEGKTPFAKEAYRVENGVFIAGEGCVRANCPGLYTQKIILHPDVKASVAAIDEEAGTVVLWMNFGDTNSYGPGNALVTFEAFKVWGGEIHVVNAFFRILPKETQRGWEGVQ